MGSAFSESTENEKIKTIYGNSGFWAWLRYWYLDTKDYTTMMLIDKGYYDYDYEKPKEKPQPMSAEKKRIWSDVELQAVLSRAINPATGKPIFTPESPTIEELQEIVREEIKSR